MQGCKYGKPIVDLCLWMTASMSYNRVENVLMQFGKKAKEITGIGAFGEDRSKYTENFV